MLTPGQNAPSRPPWFRLYLLIAGTAIIAIGGTLVFRSFFQRHSTSGLALGATLIVYGFLRLRQRKTMPFER